ncbi:MAG: phytanoyl-CoA dioxygenase family protein [Planctomycetota bacterium]
MKSRIAVSRAEFSAGVLEEQTCSNAGSMFREHGALWLEDVIDSELVSELARVYEQKYVSLGKGILNRRHAKVGHSRFMVTLEIEPPFDSHLLFANPLLLPILKSLLGHDCRISSFGSVVTFAGADQQQVHLDFPPLYESEQLCASLPPHAITLVIPLVELDAKTGSTAIWEGSHRSPGSRQLLTDLMESPTLDGSVHPLARAGDVYLMDYRVIHAGMANDSDVSRPILYIVYCRKWFRDAYNFHDQPPVRIAADRFNAMEPRHRQLFDGHAS